MAASLEIDAGTAHGIFNEFEVSLEVFEGPFDLLLTLINRRELDITQVALAEVTDEFIAHIRAFPDLSRTTEFLIVAATLLDMKTAHLLPPDQVDEEAVREDLEARDLLFTRLLQYRAFKKVATQIEQYFEDNVGYIAREVPMEPHFANLLPELRWTITPEDLARITVEVLTQSPPTLQVHHLHEATVPVSTQLSIIAQRVKSAGKITFNEILVDAQSTAVVISRFLAVLELFRSRIIDFIQEIPLGTLTLCWVADTEDLPASIEDTVSDASIAQIKNIEHSQ